jgi:hypothetical protein
MAVALLLAPAAARAGLERVGPVLSSVGYPQWFQDATGITFEFCSVDTQFELDNGLCLLLPGDTTVPEVFPSTFADEHFYWAADANGDWTLPGFTGAGVGLVLGLEAAFAVGPPVPGDQIVFGRLRIRVDAIPLSGTYTVYTPYGKYVFENQVAGERIFFTEDIGITCARGDFTCALGASIGPFLLPSNTPGGPELPPVSFPETGTKLFIADPGRDGPVTGSVLPPYEVLNGGVPAQIDPNVFRVEAPNGAVIFETNNFTLMGRLFTGNIAGRIDVERASYSRDGGGQQLDVFATGFPTRQARLPATPVVQPEAPALVVYASPCSGTIAPDGTLVGPFGAPAGTASAPLRRNGTVYFSQIPIAAVPTHVCVANTNARNGSGQIVPLYFNIRLTDKVNVAEATYDPDAQTLLVVASSMDALFPPLLTVSGFGDVPNTDLTGGSVLITTNAPPARVRVTSSSGGGNEAQVSVVLGSGVPNELPVAVADTAQTLSNTPVEILVLENDSDPDGNPIVVNAVTQPANGTVTVNGGLSVTYAPTPLFVGTDAFTYTITDQRGGFATATVVVTVDLAPNVPPVATADLATTLFQTAVTVNVLANDTDANGDPLAVIAVSQPGAGGVATFTPTSVTFIPADGFAGTTTFTYTVADGRGGETPGLVTVTVRPAETIAFTLAQFRQPNEWRLSGTGSINGSVITLYAGPTVAGGTVIGTATVTGGLWTFRGNPNAVPVNARVSARSNNGGIRENQTVTIR